MIKSELIAKICEAHPNLVQRDVELVVSTVFNEIAEALAKGDRVELRGFGAFSVKLREARTARNPRTGEMVDVPEKRVPFFPRRQGAPGASQRGLRAGRRRRRRLIGARSGRTMSDRCFPAPLRADDAVLYEALTPTADSSSGIGGRHAPS